MNFANSTVSQKQSNAERLMRCIIYSSHWLRTILLFVVKSAFYILTLAWGFRRCSFRLVGQCESLYSVERVTEQAPRFFVCIQNINQSNDTEWSCCSNGNGMRLEKWFISNLDDSQRKIIVQSIDEDIIVQGAAGSGKTNLAIHRALQAKNGSPDKPRGLSIQPCKSEKEEPYIRYSSQGRSECLYLRIE